MPEFKIFILRHHQNGWRIRHIPIHRVLGRIPKERRHGIKLALRDWIKLMVVTGGATDCQSEKHTARGFSAVLGINRFVFLDNGPTLIGRDVVTLKATRDQLIK